MITFPQIDPVIVSLGPLQIRWYGMMYVLGFMSTYFLVRHQIRKFGYTRMEEHFENLNITLILGMVLGGRLGYVLFYNLPYYLQNPLEILATWHGGMSFHGGLLGVAISGYIFARRHGIDYLQGADAYVATAPIGLGLGRLGNFINGELFGRVTDAPWGMVFPAGGPLPRHPSQLYEFFLEGVFLFAVLWPLKNMKMPSGSLLAVFLILYGVLRYIVELFREPDAHLGFILGPLTMGQILSSGMILVGFALFFYRNKKNPFSMFSGRAS